MMFPKDNELRKACVYIASHKLFEWWVWAAGG